MTSMRIVHLSSVHSRRDTRVFLKQCRSLAARGHEVILMVADGEGDASVDGVRILDAGRPRSRLDRMLHATRRIGRRALPQAAAVYHLHDPELMPLGLRLKRLGKTVVFDAHEDLPKQLLSKPYLGALSRRLLSGTLAAYEHYACHQFDGIVTATPAIREKFLRINPYTVDINNFPLADELAAATPWEERRREVCYLGAISRIRGIRELIAACDLLRSDVRLNLVGAFGEDGLAEELRTQPGWARVNALGVQDRAGVRQVLARSLAGLVTFHALPNHLNAQPNKMFEYMSSGIPVIASRFPLWREVVEGNACGLCVDPHSPQEIAEAIDYLARNPAQARRMGENGRQAVLGKYNWKVEESKLMRFYDSLF